jgi:type II secretory pathway pseudopilin PulG
MNTPLPGRRRAGFTYVEVTAAFAVLVLGVVGFASTVLYTRNLDRTTTQLRRSAATASDTLEDVRRDSAGNWASLTSNWDGTTVRTDGGRNDAQAILKATVSDDAGTVAPDAMMWSIGAATPNFYHVSVSADSLQNDLAKTLNFQTYVADRTGFRSLAVDAGQNTAPGVQQASSILPNAMNVTVTGLLADHLSFQVMNGGTQALPLTKLYLGMGATGRFVRVEAAGEIYYNSLLSPVQSKTMTPPSGLTVAIPPGLTTLKVVGVPLSFGLDPILGQTVTAKLIFEDKSTATVTVKP